MRLNSTASRQSSYMLHGTRLSQLCGIKPATLSPCSRCVRCACRHQTSLSHMSAVQGLQMPTTQGTGTWLLHNHTCNHNHTYTNDDYRLQISTSSEVPREIECCNELSYLCAGSLPEHSVPLPNHHEQHTSDVVLPCQFARLVRSNDKCAILASVGPVAQRYYCRSETVTDLADVPHLSDETQLDCLCRFQVWTLILCITVLASSRVTRVWMPSYQRKRTLLPWSSQASSGSNTNLYYTHRSLVPMIV